MGRDEVDSASLLTNVRHLPYVRQMTITSPTGPIPQWTLADGLRKSREAAGYSQGALAAHIGISRASISNYENGIHTPNRPTLLAWAMACGVSLEWLDELPRLDSNQEPSGYWELLVAA